MVVGNLSNIWSNNFFTASGSEWVLLASINRHSLSSHLLGPFSTKSMAVVARTQVFSMSDSSRTTRYRDVVLTSWDRSMRDSIPFLHNF